MLTTYQQVLFKHLNRYIQLETKEFYRCLPFFEEVEFRKNDLVVRAGKKADQQYFVASGCLRTYMEDSVNEKEYTLQFATETWWASDYIAYYTGVPAIMNVECIEDSFLFSISRSNEKLLFEEVPILEHYLRIKLENAFVAFQRRILSNLNQTADQRYEQFLQLYPDIEQRVRNYQIASYLGITPESLSRIRNRKVRKN